MVRTAAIEHGPQVAGEVSQPMHAVLLPTSLCPIRFGVLATTGGKKGSFDHDPARVVDSDRLTSFIDDLNFDSFDWITDRDSTHKPANLIDQVKGNRTGLGR